jgi:hypothetical protein
MYWTNQGSNFIRRANLDGTGQETLVSGAISPFGIALDLAGGQMYSTNTGLLDDIRRANLDGTGQPGDRPVQDLIAVDRQWSDEPQGFSE